MSALNTKLLSSTFVAALMGAGGVIAVAAVAVPITAITVKPAAASCNPCAAKKPANACNPCNPCAAKKVSNPCNPCNPCAAKPKASNCVVPSVQKAALCNPCAVKKPVNACGPCNPCAAKKACNPCNPCAAKNPCAASDPCNPCNPCGAGAAIADVELEPVEATAAYGCLNADLKAAYAGSGVPEAAHYLDWKAFSSAPYASATHGGRHVMNYANDVAEEAYGKYEEVGKMPVGSILAKDSFVVQTDGHAAVGPLFLMEKMAAGFNAASGDWKYTMIMPSGAVAGVTNGEGSENMVFCYECHMAMEDTDSLFFLPEDLRVK